MTPKKSSNKQAARARSIPRRPREPEVEAKRGAADQEDPDEEAPDEEARAEADVDRDDLDGSDEDEDENEESDSEADVALVRAKRKATPRNMPLPPPTPQRVARDGEEDDLPDEVLQFVRAIDAYKRAKRRQFPSWSEVLEVLKQLGYERRSG